MEKFFKQPAETFPIAADFGAVLADEETIDGTASSVSAKDEDGFDVTNDVIESGSLTVNGAKMIITVKGGEDGKVYQITFSCCTDIGNYFELDVRMIVKDV